VTEDGQIDLIKPLKHKPVSDFRTIPIIEKLFLEIKEKKKNRPHVMGNPGGGLRGDILCLSCCNQCHDDTLCSICHQLCLFSTQLPYLEQ